jgi:hypothetical protein
MVQALWLPKLWGSALSSQNIPRSTPAITGQITQMRKWSMPFPQIQPEAPKQPQVDTAHAFNASWPKLPKQLPETGADWKELEALKKIADYVKTNYAHLSVDERVAKVKELQVKYELAKPSKQIYEVKPNTGSRYWAIQDDKNIFWIPKIPRFNDLDDKSVKEWDTKWEVLWWFAKNLWKSALNLWSDVANFLLDPIDSATGLLKLWAGIAVNTYETVTGDEVWGRAKEYWDVATLAGQYFKDRYGSAEAFSKSAYQDPVGVFSDIVSVIWWAWALT